MTDRTDTPSPPFDLDRDEHVGGFFDVEVVPGYYPLFKALEDALDQSQRGKGRERHVRGDTPFYRQPILEITRMVGIGGPAFQAIKKIQEAIGMVERREPGAAVRELLGAIVYTAAVVVLLR
jgi:hypothetical protein